VGRALAAASVRLALACRKLRERAGGSGDEAGGGGGGGGGGGSGGPSSSILLSPPLAVVRVSTLDGPEGLDGLKRAVLDAIAWAERRYGDDLEA